MPSAERHPSELDLLALALEPSRPRGAHVAGCDACRRKVDGLAAGREHLADLERLGAEAGATPAPPPQLRGLGRTLEAAEALVRAAEAGREELAVALAEAADREEFAGVALHAAQIAARLAPKKPAAAADFGRSLRAVLAEVSPVPGPSTALAEAASKLLESQGLLYVGEASEAVRLALEALADLEAAEAPLLLLSRARYYAGSALWGASRYDEALALLDSARAGFADDAQDAWVGRAEAAIGLLHFSEARFLPALHAFDSALSRLDPGVDPGPVVSTLQNRAGILMNLGRLAEARQAFGRALELALRNGLQASATSIRVNLLNLGLDERAWSEVLARGEKLVVQCDREGLAIDAYYARLALAEAQAAMGNYGAVRSLVEALRGDAPPEVRDDPDATALLTHLSAGDQEMEGRLRRLRHYLAGRERAGEARRA